jgi:acyl transferase domain-containing protein/acyl carrier protein
MTPSHEDIVDALRSSLSERELLREENRRLVAKVKEPIAIVGMGCRFPGGVRSADDLWQLVVAEVDGISEFPTDRGWDLARLDDADPDKPGTVTTRHGGFVAGAADFDAGFFRISPREALAMDPQQRMLLEVAWEAIESAGIDPKSLAGTSAGVFAGAGGTEYAGRLASEVEGYRMTGSLTSVVTGRIAYTLGLEGPAVTVDTACSSSLVAAHLACQALRRGEISLALAGGVTVMSTPWMLEEFSRQRGLSPDGRCRSFAEDADGTGLGEGAGLLVLERLSDARRHGHRVLAVIRGSAVNQDGASNGLTAPNGPSQMRVILEALENADLLPADVDAVEAHGTGTRLGDPIEAHALLATYCHSARRTPLRLGSIKSNIGHAQAAAGVGGVIKVVMALRHGLLPRTLHIDEPSSHIDWTAGDIKLLTEAEPWPRGDRPRRAGVSSFGISGTNAHLIVEEAPDDAEAADVPDTTEPPVVAWLLSAASEPALRAQAQQLRAHVQDRPELRPVDVSFSLATGRAHLEHRAAVVGSDRDVLLAGLEALGRGEQAASAIGNSVRGGKTAFLFTGQGAQRAGMGRELASAFPVFARALDEVCGELDRHVDRPLRELLFAEPGSDDAALLDRTEFTQAALFAVEVSLFRLIESLGIRADVLAGHSVGELAAAHVAGVLSLSDACKLVAARGNLIGALPDGGGMLAIEADEDEVAESLAGWAGRLSIAALNGPRSVVVSGDVEALDALEPVWAQRGRETKRLRVSHAFHSPLVAPMLEEFRTVAQGLTFGLPQIPIVSGLSGEHVAAEEIARPEHWVRHVREAVRFADVVATLDGDGVTRYLELGPDGVLSAMAAECVGSDAHERALFVPALRARRRDGEGFAAFLAASHGAGIVVDWPALFAGGQAQRVELPTYAFQRERFWLAARPGEQRGDAGLNGHPILTNMTQIGREDQWLFMGRLSTQTHAWLDSHVISDAVVVPGTAFVDLALRAGAEIGCDVVEELTLEAPLLPSAEEAVEVQVFVESADESARRQFAIHSRAASGGEWVANASGTLAVAATQDDPLFDGFAAELWPPAGAESVDPDWIVERLGDVAGFEYGPAFLGVRSSWRRGDAIFSEVELPDEYVAESARYAVHPVLLDMALHAGFAEYTAGDGIPPGEGRMLFRWAGTRLHGPAASRLRVRAVKTGPDTISIAASSEDGRPVASVEALVARSVDVEQLHASLRGARDSLYRVEWPEVASTEPGVEPLPAAIGNVEANGLGDRYPDVAALAKAIDAGATVPNVVVAGIVAGDGPAAHETHVTVGATLELLQAWLSAECLAGSQLLIVTQGAVAAAEGDVPRAPLAAAWGLVRSAQSEHPGSFLLVDADGDGDLPWGRLLKTGEPQLALRGGALRVPRLAAVSRRDPDPAPWSSDGTVLITGGTGSIGGLLARHLADSGARHLTLVSRRGPDADGARELVGDLAARGCEAKIVACDVGDREACGALIAAASPPVTAVVHAAGVLHDATIESLSAEQLATVLRSKVDAACHLYELTEGLDLAAFVSFSSVAAVMGAPGQGNYAAANAFLDALAHRGRAAGRNMTTIAWGQWEGATGMTATLDAADIARLERMGICPIAPEVGTVLFDAALGAGDSAPVAVQLDTAALRARARDGALPAVLSELVPVRARRAHVSGGSLARELAGLPEDGWDDAVLEVVRRQVAAVLGHDSPEEVDPTRPFKDLGFDSLSAVELRNRLIRTTGLRLPSTLVFDHPTSEAVVKLVRSELSGVERVRHVSSLVPTRSDEPIAIIGMSCRFPGGVSSPDELWELLASGTDAISSFPTDRGWDLGQLHDPDPDRPGTTYTREGGFIDFATDFDAGFFGIGRSEALAMDPQQRLMLEAAWDAFQSAGIDPKSLRESDTGVFAGAVVSDYRKNVRAEQEAFRLTGTTMSVLSGRLAYVFGLEGPAMTVDTACSSSLVALHLACQALRQGECSLALGGGATIMASPYLYVDFARQRGLAPDGRCKSFGAHADGVGFSEGLGLLVLERLSDARRHGRRVFAVLRGSAVNQDGASNGLTSPNGPSQVRVIRQALQSSGLSPADVDVVEAHGTGTTLGDPIEAQALLATYGRDRADGPLRLGSIKSNIGHTSAAAGVAGVIKMALALQHGLLPRSLHCDEPSPHVDWSAGSIRLLAKQEPWERGPTPRRAGVSSFGISGTNVHMIVEEAPAEEASLAIPSGGETPVMALVVSARGENGLRAQAERLSGWLAPRPELSMVDVGWSLVSSRAALERRAVVIGGDREALLSGLDAVARGERPDGVAVADAQPGKPVFVFPGQGSQWDGMALGLLDSAPVFARSIGACDEALSRYVDWSLEDVLRGAEGAPGLERVDVVQPALFAVMVSLAALWRSYGVQPSAVVGHSQGEIAAAYVAGALSLDDAARVVVARSRVVADELAGRGGMASVALAVADAESLLDRWAGRLSVAAVNGPTSVVVSGDVAALEELLEVCEGDGVWVRRIPVDYPSHSAAVETVRERLITELASIRPQSGTVPFVSTVTAEGLDTARLDGTYWYRNLRERVRFEDVVLELIEDGTDAFLEMSPHPGLAVAIAAAADGAGAGDRVVAVGSLSRGEGGLQRFVGSLGEAYVHGVEVDWSTLYDGSGARRVDLPTYAFQRDRYWLTAPTATGDLTAAGLKAIDHPLLRTGQRLAGADEWLFTGSASRAEHGWISDHVLLDTVVLPGTAFVEIAAAAGEVVGCDTLEELTFESPLVLADGESVQLQVRMEGSDPSGRRPFAIYSRRDDDAQADGEGWTRHAGGEVGTRAQDERSELVARLEEEAWPPEGAEELDVEAIYDRLTDMGFAYGGSFIGVRAAWRRGDELFAEVALDDENADEAERYRIHPALFDTAMHGVVALLGEREDGAGRMLFHWSGMRRYAGRITSMRVRIGMLDDDRWNVAAVDDLGRAVLSVDGVVARPVERAQLARARRDHRDARFAVEWVEVSTPSTNGHRPRFALLGDVDATAYGTRHPDLRALMDAVDAGEPVPDFVLAAIAAADGSDATEDARASVRAALELVQAWLAEAALAGAQLVLVTRGAVAARDGEVPGIGAAALWGLVRSAQSEHPGRLALLDTDGADDSWHAAAVLLASGEAQLAVRDGVGRVPRIVRAGGSAPGARTPFDPDATVLITGGTSGLGALLARHLAAEHGARHLLLVSRRGALAPGADDLMAELERLGATAVLATCDVADRDALDALLASVPAEHPLKAVIHAAGVLEDGVVAGLTPEQVDRVMRPKADGALLLHELTQNLALDHFVVISSFAATLGSPGQGNYAAANAVTDALVQRRHARGLPAKALVYGAWSESGGMTSTRSGADLSRITRLGAAPLSDAEGLALFDATIHADEPLPVLVPFETATLNRLAHEGALAPILSKLAGERPARRAAADSLRRRLSRVPDTEWLQLVLDLVCDQVASVLGLESPAAVEPQLAFKQMGFDSLSAVELRNGLMRTARLQLPATLVFDHPTPAAVADHILGQVGSAGGSARPSIEAELDRIERMFERMAADDDGRAQVESGMRALNARMQRLLDGPDLLEDDAGADLELASDEEMFAMIDEELGA